MSKGCSCPQLVPCSSLTAWHIKSVYPDAIFHYACYHFTDSLPSTMPIAMQDTAMSAVEAAEEPCCLLVAVRAISPITSALRVYAFAPCVSTWQVTRSPVLMLPRFNTAPYTR